MCVRSTWLIVVQKYLDNVSHDDPLMSCLVSPSWDEEVCKTREIPIFGKKAKS